MSSSPTKKSPPKTPKKVGPDAEEIEEGSVQWVKAGADNKDRALLIGPGALRRIVGALAVILVLFVTFLGLNVRYVGDIEARANESRLQQAIRTTAEKVGMVERIRDRLGKKNGSAAGDDIGKTLKLATELQDAQIQHERAQAEVISKLKEEFKDGDAATHKPGYWPQKDIQKRMLEEFVLKAKFLVWGTQTDLANKWKKSAHFGEDLDDDIVRETDDLSDAYTEGLIDTKSVIDVLVGNITQGRYPPPVSVLESLDDYIDSLTEEEFGEEWEEQHDMRWSATGAERQHTVRQAMELQLKTASSALDAYASGTDTLATAFAEVHTYLVKIRLANWLFPADDPTLATGVGADFVKYAYLAAGSGEGFEDSEREVS